MGGLQRFEQRLESMVYGAFAKVFRSAVQPVEIAAALERECDNNAQILSRQRRAVPNDFHVELAATDFDRLAPYDSTLVGDLTQQLQEHADQQHYVFPGPITIAFESADDLGTGRFRIKSRAQAGVTSNSNLTRQRRPRAVLEVNGTKHPLTPPGLVIGRGTEADVRINDPGVSRRHIEFLVLRPRGRRRHRGGRPRLHQRHARRRPPDPAHLRARRQPRQDRRDHDHRPGDRGAGLRGRRLPGCLS